MKRNLLLGTALLAAISTFSQSNAKAKPVGVVNMKMIAEEKYSDHGLTPQAVAATSQPTKPNARTSSNTWQNFTSSMNIYGVTISFSKPLQWNDELDAVTFVHRKSPSYLISPTPAANAETGGIVTMVTKDWGANWDSTAVYANDNNWGRYPSGAIYNPAGNTDINNAYIVAAGPVTGNAASTWIGNYYASKKLGTYDNAPSTAPGAQQIMLTAGPFAPNVPSRHDFSAYGFTSSDNGKVRILAGITDDATTSDTAVMLMTGTFNSSTNTFDWAGRVFDPPTTSASDNTENWVTRPMMAWNEAGTTGYVVIIGSRLGNTGSNVGFQPIVYKTTDAGSTWSLENGINFDTPEYNALKERLWATNAVPTLTVPNFTWIEGLDCTVDANNKLHIFTSLVAHPSVDPDSLNFISQFITGERYRWPHTPGAQPYLYDFVYDGTNSSPSWSHILVDSMSSEGISATASGAGYQDNPWDMDPTQSNQKVRLDARLQMSRTPDGKYLMYTWTESDTAYTDNQKKWNNLPNIKARLFNVTENKVHPQEINVTEDAQGDVANRAMFYFVSPKFKLNTVAEGLVDVTVPLTISNSNPYAQRTANTHWFSAASMQFTLNVVGLSENKQDLLNNSSIFPNPAKTNATVQLNLANSSKVQINVVNTMGQVVKTVSTQGQTGTNNINVDLSGLASGVYLVTLKTDNATGTRKLIIE